MNQQVLHSRSYLIVEDEYLTASSLVMALEDAGAHIVGPVSDVAGAVELLDVTDNGIDAAVLDINLRGMVYSLAERLMEQNLPFVFVTGYDCEDLPAKFRTAPCLSKPCDESELIRRLLELGSRLRMEV